MKNYILTNHLVGNYNIFNNNVKYKIFFNKINTKLKPVILIILTKNIIIITTK